MRRAVIATIALVLVALGLAPAFHAFDAAAQPPPAPGAPPPPGAPPAGKPGEPPPAGGPEAGHPAPPPFEWNQARAESLVTELLEKIKGKEDMPAESVYKNIQILKGMPAKRVAPIMVMGFSRSLGMRCGGCHVREDFSSDEKGNKKTARAMWTMTQDINRKYLPEMKDLEDEHPIVNCWTCHRGNHEPEVNAPAPGEAKPAH
jgi:hypothetical protein